MIDRFEELRTYVTIVEAGGVNAAAAPLRIARSAVSRRLSDLEKRLGSILVERSTRRFELTEMGRALYDDSKRVLADVAALESRFATVAGAEKLTIAVDGDIAPLIARALASFVATRSDGPTALTIVKPAMGTDADITISQGDAGSGRPIGSNSRVVVCAPDYLKSRATPVTPAELGEHVGIAVRQAHDEWTFKAGVTVRPVIAYDVPDVMTALTIAVAGGGLAQLPHHIAQSAIESGALVRLLAAHEPEPRQITAQSEPGPNLANLLIDHLARKPNAGE